MGMPMPKDLKYFGPYDSMPASGSAGVRAWLKIEPEGRPEDQVAVTVTCFLPDQTHGDRYTISVPKSKARDFFAALAEDPKVSSISLGSDPRED